jgi:glycine hydroxymethyltransferase
LQSAIFPGVQGSLHSNVLAAKAVCLGEALRAEFRHYGRRVVANARKMAAVLMDRGIKVVGDGTDTHMVLLDLRPLGISGLAAESALAGANITSNRNPVPFDVPKPADWSGLRLGVSAATTRGFDESATAELADCIAELIGAESEGRLEAALPSASRVVAALCERFPTDRAV